MADAGKDANRHENKLAVVTAADQRICSFLFQAQGHEDNHADHAGFNGYHLYSVHPALNRGCKVDRNGGHGSQRRNLCICIRNLTATYLCTRWSSWSLLTWPHSADSLYVLPLICIMLFGEAQSRVGMIRTSLNDQIRPFGDWECSGICHAFQVQPLHLSDAHAIQKRELLW